MIGKAVKINIDEKLLVEKCRQGDSEATERLILRYQDRIYNVILRMCANRDDAAELMQETFVKIIENIGKFKGKSSFYTWAFRIAVNLTITYCQKNVRLGYRSMDVELGQGTEENKGALKNFLQDYSEPSPTKVAENKELCELLVMAMMRLDETQRTVIVLRDIESMSYAEIADVLKVELGTVKSRLSRARGNLKEILETILK